MKKISVILLFTVIIALFLPSPVLAKEAFDDKVVFGGTFTLESGEIHNGSLVVFGGAVTIEKNSTVNGDVVLIGGTVQVSGEVNGGVVGIGGAVRLNEGADILGDLFTLGAALRRDEGTNVRGQVINGFDIADNLSIPEESTESETTTSETPRVTVDASPILDTIWFLFRLFMYAVIAVILMMFLPKHIDRISAAAVTQPVITSGAGLLTSVIAPFALVALTITIILIPVTLVSILLLFAAWLIGWISIGAELGRRIAELVKLDWAPAISAGVGTFLLFFVLGGFKELIPCIGLLPYFLISIWGLGAVILTRFGTQDYAPNQDDGSVNTISHQDAPEISVGSESDLNAEIEQLPEMSNDTQAGREESE
jgi:hypothetical protein